MNRLPMYLLFFGTASLYAGASLNERVADLESQMQEIITDTQLGDFGAKTASAQPQIKSSRFFSKLDAFLWKAFSGGNDYAITNKSISSDIVIGDTKRADFRWRWGWRAEVGYRLPHDGWDALANFTWYHSKSDNSASSPVGGTITPLLSTFESLEAGASTSILWHLLFEDCDVDLRRSYFLSKDFSVAPFFGMRNTWIHQGYRARYVNPGDTSPTVVKGEQHFWGIGPLAGFGTEWHVNSQWWFFGTFSGSILASKYNISSNQVTTSTTALTANTQRMSPNMQGALGFGWQTNFNANKNHVALRLCYEAQYFWKQNLMLAYGADENPISRNGEDLGLQGFTLDLLFDF